MLTAAVKHNEAMNFYKTARKAIDCSPFVSEVCLLNEPVLVDESSFLRESAWVVLNSGFRESTVRTKFDFISLAYFDWESAHEIVRNAKLCEELAYEVFANKSKLRAISNIAAIIIDRGFAEFWRDVESEAYVTLQTLPYIGPVTAWHLMKNLGFNVSKPDRHLRRCADAFGFQTGQEMCNFLSRATGDSVAAVDHVVWRYMATLKGT